MARNYNPGIAPAENNRLTLADQVANGATAAQYRFPASNDEVLARALANASQMAQEGVQVGVVGGAVGPLDENLQMPASQLPSEIDARIQVLSGTDAALATEVLALGEIAAPTDKDYLRRGDGVSEGGRVMAGAVVFSGTQLYTSVSAETTIFNVSLPSGAYKIEWICQTIGTVEFACEGATGETVQAGYEMSPASGGVLTGMPGPTVANSAVTSVIVVEFSSAQELLFKAYPDSATNFTSSVIVSVAY